jgi:hypothetical protein
VDHAAGHVERLIAALDAVLNVTLHGAERTARDIGLAAGIGKTVLEGNVERSAEGIEAKQRVGAFHIDLVDGDIGDEIPIDGITERLIEADAIHVHGNALRGTLQWRNLEAVVEQRWLVGIA